MKFAHLSDCHIGSWRDIRLSEASTKAFIKAMDICKKEQVDFILIAGDLFDTSLPSVDRLKDVTLKLKEIRDNGIRIYVVPGSHDFSPTGKTMLDVLENAGLFINVAKGTVEDGILKLKFVYDKTGAKITGMPGAKGQLEKKYYERLDLENLEQEKGFKIFLLHSLITELKPEREELGDSTPASLLPKGFDYYAGGHPHRVMKKNLPEYGQIAYPGPLFPNNMAELEKLHNGGFYIAEMDNELKLNWHPVVVHNVHSIKVDASRKNPLEIEQEVIRLAEDKEFFNTIVTLRIEGKLISGKSTDINFKQIYDLLASRGAHCVLKNTAALFSEKLDEIKTKAKTVEEIEYELIKEHAPQFSFGLYNSEELTKKLMSLLDKEKAEGETTATFEQRVKSELATILPNIRQ